MAFLHRVPLPALLLIVTLPACGPKDGSDDSGDETGVTTTGDEVTTGDSDPTTPATASASASGTSNTGGSGGTTATSTSTSTPGDPSTSTSTSTSGDTSDPTGMTTVQTGGTSATTDPDPPDPVDPPVPCEGEATPLVGITTEIGYLQSQVPPRPDTTGGTSTTGGGELDPGTLFLKLSDQKFSCADPNALLACGPHWEVTIVIPPEFQTPGIHNLLGQDVRGLASESGMDSGNNECSFGGGSFSATFEILAIDDKVVDGRLCNVDDLFLDVDPQLEGSFTATRCPE